MEKLASERGRSASSLFYLLFALPTVTTNGRQRSAKMRSVCAKTAPEGAQWNGAPVRRAILMLRHAAREEWRMPGENRPPHRLLADRPVVGSDH